jgi:hypothetical protein
MIDRRDARKGPMGNGLLQLPEPAEARTVVPGLESYATKSRAYRAERRCSCYSGCRRSRCREVGLNIWSYPGLLEQTAADVVGPPRQADPEGDSVLGAAGRGSV